MANNLLVSKQCIKHSAPVERVQPAPVHRKQRQRVGHPRFETMSMRRAAGFHLHERKVYILFTSERAVYKRRKLTFTLSSKYLYMNSLSDFSFHSEHTSHSNNIPSKQISTADFLHRQNYHPNQPKYFPLLPKHLALTHPRLISRFRIPLRIWTKCLTDSTSAAEVR